MDPVLEEELTGLEYELTEIQNYIDNFDEEKALSNFAANQGYPKDGTFGGPLACGKDGYKMRGGEPMLDKNGEPIVAFICSHRKPMEYYALLDNNKVIREKIRLNNLMSFLLFWSMNSNASPPSIGVHIKKLSNGKDVIFILEIQKKD